MNNLIQSIHHVSLIVADTKKSLGFYRGILGLELETRPNLGYPGAWLKIGDQQLHLLELPNPDSVSGRPEHGGRDRHIAVRVADYAALVARLQQHDIAYSESKSGRCALFCRDPDGNALEFVG